eukprot:RCo022776
MDGASEGSPGPSPVAGDDPASASPWEGEPSREAEQPDTSNVEQGDGEKALQEAGQDPVPSEREVAAETAPAASAAEEKAAGPSAGRQSPVRHRPYIFRGEKVWVRIGSHPWWPAQAMAERDLNIVPGEVMEEFLASGTDTLMRLYNTHEWVFAKASDSAHVLPWEC